MGVGGAEGVEGRKERVKKTSLGYFGKRSQESSFFPLLPHPPVGEERTSQPMAIAKSSEIMEIL